MKEHLVNEEELDPTLNQTMKRALERKDHRADQDRGRVQVVQDLVHVQLLQDQDLGLVHDQDPGLFPVHGLDPLLELVRLHDDLDPDQKPLVVLAHGLLLRSRVPIQDLDQVHQHQDALVLVLLLLHGTNRLILQEILDRVPVGLDQDLQHKGDVGGTWKCATVISHQKFKV